MHTAAEIRAHEALCHDARDMPWIAVLVATWLLVFLLGGVTARWILSGISPPTVVGWMVVMVAAALLASAATMGLAAGRWRQDARSHKAAMPRSVVTRELRLGNGYVLLAATFAVAAALLVLVYRLVYTV
jgi:hypothetical protein